MKRGKSLANFNLYNFVNSVLLQSSVFVFSFSKQSVSCFFSQLEKVYQLSLSRARFFSSLKHVFAMSSANSATSLTSAIFNKPNTMLLFSAQILNKIILHRCYKWISAILKCTLILLQDNLFIKYSIRQMYGGKYRISSCCCIHVCVCKCRLPKKTATSPTSAIQQTEHILFVF